MQQNVSREVWHRSQSLHQAAIFGLLIPLRMSPLTHECTGRRVRPLHKIYPEDQGLHLPHQQAHSPCENIHIQDRET
jgi:hypothetical protein